jgi:DNA-binding response OmpR family regulator
VSSQTPPTIMMVGHDRTLTYLLGRFAEHGGYQLKTTPENLSVDEVTSANPAAIIFLSPELLETTQSLLRDITNLETPILVCSTAADEVKARELGADHCLLHPLTFDDFQTALRKISKRPYKVPPNSSTS